MPTAFSSVTAANAPAIAKVFNSSAIQFAFVNATPQAIAVNALSDAFSVQLTNIKSRFNLDRSESARRVYIDVFLHEALPSAAREAIITIEEAISAAAIGQGTVDYIVAAVLAGSETVQYQPSIIIEAKKGMSTVALRDGYQWQLLAEMAAAKECYDATPGAIKNRGHYYGVLSDGRYWTFYSVSTIVDRTNHLTAYRSDLLDSETASDCKLIIGSLRYWMAQYTNASGGATLFKS